LFDRIQNISLPAGGKSDGCDAEEYAHDPQTRADLENHAGMIVAPIPDGSQKTDLEKETSVMLWTILVILLVLWLVGLLTHVGGGLIHLLLVVAVVVLVINLVTGRRAV
jgi:hypothetical protein